MNTKNISFCTVVALLVALGYFSGDVYLPAMPVLRHYFASNTVAIQTTLSIYMLGMVLAQISMGPISQRYGFKQTAIPLSMVFIAASILCAFSPSILVLSMGRLVQSLAVGGLMVIGRASFYKYYPAEQAASMYIAIVPTIAVFSPAIAPIVGGFLTEHLSWQSIFIFLAIFAAVIFVGMLAFYPIKSRDPEHSLHPAKILKTYGGMLKHRLLLGYLVVITLMFVIYLAYMAETPFIFHQLGYSAQQIGYAYIGISILFLITSQSARKLLKHFSAKWVMNLGYVIVLFGMLLFIVFAWLFKPSMWTVIAPGTIYVGAIGLINPVAMSRGMAAFAKLSGYASSLVGAAAMFGSMLGAQFANIVTDGSIIKLGLYSLLALVVSYVALILLARKHQQQAE